MAKDTQQKTATTPKKDPIKVLMDHVENVTLKIINGDELDSTDQKVLEIKDRIIHQAIMITKNQTSSCFSLCVETEKLINLLPEIGAESDK